MTENSAVAVSSPQRAGRWRGALRLSALERRVFLVAAAGLLPIAMLTCATLIFTALDQKERLLRANEETMLAVVTAIDAELKSTIAALEAVGTSSRLAADDFAGLHEEARQLLKHRPTWLNVVVSTPDSQQLMNAYLPLGAPLPNRVAPQTAAATLRVRRPTVSDVLYTPVLKAHIVAVQIPYYRDGEIKYLLTAAIRPDSLLPLLEQQSIPDQGVIGIFDRKHNVVARSLHQNEWVGKQPASGLVKLLQERRQRGWARGKTLEGVGVYSVFYRSSFSGWSAAIGIPRELIDRPLERSYLLFVGSILLSVALGLVAALLVGRTIVRPIRELEQSAAQVGRGEAPTLPHSRLPEISRVGSALAVAHSEREQLLHRERNARLAAEQASRSKDEFLAMLGHELRNPLAAITNAAQVLDRHQPAQPSSPTTHATGIVLRQAKHLTRLTDDLLDAGRVILGKIALARMPLDLGALVESNVDALRTTGRLLNHEVRVHLQSVWIDADATRMDQIVSNLITNAVKYTPERGVIDVTVRREDEDAVFEVADNGIGIGSDLLPRVFDLFVQGERSIDRSQGGLGIGLTLVKRLTALHGGTVHVASAGTGRGSSFTVRLRAISPQSTLPPRYDEATRSKLRVALVEDNDDARMSLRMLLQLDGHQVVEACDGPTGLDLLLANAELQVAFIDIGLPGIDGYAVARAVRAQRSQRICLVAMSGYGSDLDKARGLEAGFDAYLVKPVEATHLQRILAELPDAGSLA